MAGHADWQQVAQYYQFMLANNYNNGRPYRDILSSNVQQWFAALGQMKPALIAAIRNIPTLQVNNAQKQRTQVISRIFLYYINLWFQETMGCPRSLLNQNEHITNIHTALAGRLNIPANFANVITNAFGYIQNKTNYLLQQSQVTGAQNIGNVQLAQQKAQEFMNACATALQRGAWDHTLFVLRGEYTTKNESKAMKAMKAAMFHPGNKQWLTQNFAAICAILTDEEKAAFQEAYAHGMNAATGEKLGTNLYRMAAQGEVLECMIYLYMMCDGNHNNFANVWTNFTSGTASLASALMFTKQKLPPVATKDLWDAGFVQKRKLETPGFKWDIETPAKYLWNRIGKTPQTFMPAGNRSILALFDAIVLDFFKGQDYTQQQAIQDAQDHKAIFIDVMYLRAMSGIPKETTIVFNPGNLFKEMNQTGVQQSDQSCMAVIPQNRSPLAALSIIVPHLGTNITIANFNNVIYQLQQNQTASHLQIKTKAQMQDNYRSFWGFDILAQPQPGAGPHPPQGPNPGQNQPPPQNVHAQGLLPGNPAGNLPGPAQLPHAPQQQGVPGGAAPNALAPYTLLQQQNTPVSSATFLQSINTLAAGSSTTSSGSQTIIAASTPNTTLPYTQPGTISGPTGSWANIPSSGNLAVLHFTPPTSTLPVISNNTAPQSTTTIQTQPQITLPPTSQTLPTSSAGQAIMSTGTSSHSSFPTMNLTQLFSPGTQSAQSGLIPPSSFTPNISQTQTNLSQASSPGTQSTQITLLPPASSTSTPSASQTQTLTYASATSQQGTFVLPDPSGFQKSPESASSSGGIPKDIWEQEATTENIKEAQKYIDQLPDAGDLMDNTFAWDFCKPNDHTIKLVPYKGSIGYVHKANLLRDFLYSKKYFCETLMYKDETRLDVQPTTVLNRYWNRDISTFDIEVLDENDMGPINTIGHNFNLDIKLSWSPEGAFLKFISDGHCRGIVFPTNCEKQFFRPMINECADKINAIVPVNADSSPEEWKEIDDGVNDTFLESKFYMSLVSNETAIRTAANRLPGPIHDILQETSDLSANSPKRVFCALAPRFLDKTSPFYQAISVISTHTGIQQTQCFIWMCNIVHCGWTVDTFLYACKRPFCEVMFFIIGSLPEAKFMHDTAKLPKKKEFACGLTKKVLEKPAEAYDIAAQQIISKFSMPNLKNTIAYNLYDGMHDKLRMRHIYQESSFRDVSKRYHGFEFLTSSGDVKAWLDEHFEYPNFELKYENLKDLGPFQ